MSAPTRRRTSRDEALTSLAARAEAIADALHAQLGELQRLCDTLPSHIDDLAGDRAYNWSLNADLGYAQTALHALSVKTRTVARHAREGTAVSAERRAGR